jgi:competence CoiA-like predicted nuclease
LNPGRDGRTGFVTQRLAQGQSSFQHFTHSSASMEASTCATEGVIHHLGRVMELADWLKVEYDNLLPCVISIAPQPD